MFPKGSKSKPTQLLVMSTLKGPTVPATVTFVPVVGKILKYNYFPDGALPGVYEWRFQLCYAANQASGLPADADEVKLLDCSATLQLTVKAGKPEGARIASRDGDDGIVGTNEDGQILLVTLLDGRGNEVPAELDFVSGKTWQISVPNGMAWEGGASDVSAASPARGGRGRIQQFVTIPPKCISVFERKYVRIVGLKLRTLEALSGGVSSVPMLLRCADLELLCADMRVAALRATNVELLCGGVPLVSAKNMSSLDGLTAKLTNVHGAAVSAVSFEYRSHAARPAVILKCDAFQVKTVKVRVVVCAALCAAARAWSFPHLHSHTRTHARARGAQATVGLDGTAKFDDVSVNTSAVGTTEVTAVVGEGKGAVRAVVPLEVVASGLTNTMVFTLGKSVSVPMGGTATLSVLAGTPFSEASFACTDETGASAGPTHVRVVIDSDGASVGAFVKRGVAYVRDERSSVVSFSFPEQVGQWVLLRFETTDDEKRQKVLCRFVFVCVRACNFAVCVLGLCVVVCGGAIFH